MPIITNTRGKESGILYPFSSDVIRLSDNKVVTSSSVWAAHTGTMYVRSGFPVESITGYRGVRVKDALNNVSHSKRKLGGQGGIVSFDGPAVYTGSTHKWCKRRFYSVYLDPHGMISAHDAHSGTLSGIKALAIARIPAYSKPHLNAFIAMREAQEAANVAAIKAANALARYGTLVVRNLNKGRLKQFVSREAKRTLGALVSRGKQALTDPKAAWETVLAGTRGLNAADMTWKYGIAPMITDCQGANRALAKMGDLHAALVKGTRVYGHARDTRTSSGFTSALAGTSDNMTFGPIAVNYHKTTTTVARASIVRRLNPASPMYNVDWFNQLDVVFEVNGFEPSLKDAWQLSSLTFITDWFWNVANLLESLQELKSPVGSSFTSTGSMYSESRVTEVTGAISVLSGQSGISRAGAASRSSYSRATDPLTGGPALYIPPLTLPTKAGQWFSMAQIAFQRYTA